MREFIARENIKRYKQMLANTVDDGKREIVRHLLANEEARLQQLQSESGIADDWS